MEAEPETRIRRKYTACLPWWADEPDTPSPPHIHGHGSTLAPDFPQTREVYLYFLGVSTTAKTCVDENNE